MGQSRNEDLLENILGAQNPFGAPQSREEAILQNMLGAENVLGAPQSREEDLLMQVLEKGIGGEGLGLAIFADGKFENDDVFEIKYSTNPSAAKVTISDDYLIIPSTSGIVIGTKNDVDFTLIFDFASADGENNGYIQYGNCIMNADPYVCIVNGNGRHAFATFEPAPGTSRYGVVCLNTPETYEVFMAGGNIKIKSIYGILGYSTAINAAW